MKEKTKHRTKKLKNQALYIVALMIVGLAVLFVLHISQYNRKEIRSISDSYVHVVEKYYETTKKHIFYAYHLILVDLSRLGGIVGIVSGGDRSDLLRLTRDYFDANRPRPYLLAINWYFPGSPVPLSFSSSRRGRQFGVAAANPLWERGGEGWNTQWEFQRGFFSLSDGVTYRIIRPLPLPGGAIGAVEAVVSPHHFVVGIEDMLGLKGLVLMKLKPPARSGPGREAVGGGYYLVREAGEESDWSVLLDRIDPSRPGFRHETALEGKEGTRHYLVRHHFDIGDYQGEAAAKVVSIHDITDLKLKINRTIYQIILLTLVVLVVVFIILYYSFGNIMDRLLRQETRLKEINTELEQEIGERQLAEDELKRHRDQLEDLVARRTRQLEIKNREIETNEIKLRTITSAIRDAIVMVNHTGAVSYWSPSAEYILGHAPGEILGVPFVDGLIMPGSRPDFDAAVERLHREDGGDGYGGIIEIECRRKNGDVFPAELMVSQAEIGGEVNLIVLLRDITLKKAEEMEKRILLRAVEQSSVGIQISDTRGIIRYVNPKFTEITGYQKEDVIGQKTSILKSDFNPANYYKKLWDSIRSGKDWHGELYNRRKDGGLYWDSTLISPIKDPGGHITHFVAVKEDITQRKNMEIELLKAKEAAETASRSKGEFLANMSHEIRTPMNAIIGMTELALGTVLSGEQQEYLEIVRQSSRSLLKLLNDILDFSKVEAGKLILEPVCFRLRKVLADTAKSLAVQADKKNLELVYYIDPDVPDRLIGDAGRLRQIIVNLIGNSIKFTGEGEIVLKIEVLEEGLENKILLHFVVSDTGIGISEGQLSNIFEKFSQADSSTTRKYGGTGLGLAISSRLVELMGGVIWAESPATFNHFQGITHKRGPGSTFHFTALFELAGEPPEEQGKRQKELEQLKDLRLLVVDDNETNRRFLREVLHRHSLMPEIVSAGSAALEMLRGEGGHAPSYKLVILDFRMPEMDGIEVMQRMRKELKLDIPVILLTSGLKVDDLSKIKESGVAAHLLKPISSTELLETILEVLGHKGVRKQRENIPLERDVPQDRETTAHILVAEDNMINQRLIRRLLEKRGHRVDVVPDGQKAVERFLRKTGSGEEQYSMILMDIQMPEMDGIEATREIRKVDGHIPIIALTAHAMKGDRNKFLSEGMNDYVSKPIDKKILFDIIGKYLPDEGQ